MPLLQGVQRGVPGQCGYCHVQGGVLFPLLRQNRLRPLSDYAFGWIDKWARLGSMAPGLANATVNAPGVQQLFKKLLGIASARQFPRLASRTFRIQGKRTMAESQYADLNCAGEA